MYSPETEFPSYFSSPDKRKKPPHKIQLSPIDASEINTQKNISHQILRLSIRPIQRKKLPTKITTAKKAQAKFKENNNQPHETETVQIRFKR